MKNASKRCQNRFGSVLIVVISVFAVLAIFFVSLMKSATSRTYSIKKLGDKMLARELANSLAVVSFQYIKTVELKNEGSSLRKLLAEPMPYGDSKYEKGDLVSGIKANVKEGSENIIDVLLKKSGLNDIKIEELTWRLHKSDFSPIKLGTKDSPYPREKKGVVRVFMKLSYKLPGQKESITEDYLFVSSINVVANILPVLSKFNFYIKDAFGGNRPKGKELLDRFNVVRTSAGGKINSGTSYYPWIFQNGDEGSYYSTYKDFIKHKKGFIYLGGGTNEEPITLGIARGFAGVAQGDYGEDFHFYKKAKGGYWKTYEVWEDGSGILSANIGLCDDESTSNLISWQLLFGEGYKENSKKNSIFRLYGTDAKGKSPTVVLGYVNSMSGDARAYKGANRINKLAFFDREEDFINYSSLKFTDGSVIALDYGEDFAQIKDFASAYSDRTGLDNSSDSELSKFYQDYKDKYCTRLIERRYNLDYAYIIAKIIAEEKPGYDEDSMAYPLEYCSNLIDGDLKDLSLKQKNDLFVKVPSTDGALYDKIYSTSELDKLDTFFDKSTLLIDGSKDSENNDRIAHNIEYSEAKGRTINDNLIVKGLLRKNTSSKFEFDPNGWIYIESSVSPVKLGAYTSLSQGGFIVAGKDGIQCNVELNGNLSGEHLTIIALDGDIVINNGVKKLNASLIAGKGQLKLNNSDEVDVTGNIVMKELTKSNIESSFKHRLILNYNESLAALPFAKDRNLSDTKLKRTEFPLLMFDLKEKILMLD